MTKIVGRHKAIQSLHEAYNSAKPEMVALIGRRRVGKTFLIKKVYQGKINFELTGLQHGDKKEQLQNFNIALSQYFPNFKMDKKPTSWLDAFFELSKACRGKKKKEKKVIFLDEIPWIGTKRSGFLKGLGWFWNSWASNENVVLVICGSAASWMIEKIINDHGGLHNRVTELLHIEPFTMGETEEFLQSNGVNLNRYQVIQIYMIMGGVPMYLDQVRAGLSSIQNIQKICFEPSGYLKNEFERLYASLFKNYKNHVEIIRALGSKRKGLSRLEIIEKTRFKNGGMISDILKELHLSGFIDIYGNYKKKKRESIYRLTDPYSLFYLTFIEPLGPNSGIEFTKLSDLPKWKTWSGYAFENVCLKHVDQIRHALSNRWNVNFNFIFLGQTNR